MILLPLLVFALTVTTPQQRGIHIYGGHWKDKVGPELRQMLGDDYVIDYKSTYRMNPPKVVVELLDLAPDNDDWKYWAEHEDDFIYQVKTFIRDEIGDSDDLRFLIGPDIDDPIYTQHFVPLVRQLARECGRPLIDLSKSKEPAKDLYLDLATFQRNPGSWRVVSATSEQTDEGPVKNAIDNNPDTYWHTRYDPNPTKVPHEIVIDLGKTETLNGFSYLARQDGGINGRVKDFELFLSDDPNKWGEPALKGTLQNTMNEQRLLFPKAASGRYLKFVALSEVNGNIWTSIAELGILHTGNSK
jgi:hypothetical protein